MKISEILFKAADLIEPEGAWTQGALARGADGEPVEPEDRDATCWCISGALMRLSDGQFYELIKPVERVIGGRIIPAWNDTKGRTQAEVVAKLREAATKAQEQGL